MSADTIVPDATNPQSFNRYSYTQNNPLKYNDPNGHCPSPASNGYSGSTEIICIAWFIPTARSEVPLSPDFVGDSRDFSANSNKNASRAWAWIDADTGDIIRQEVHETCNTWGQCAGPLDDEGIYQNQIDSKRQEDGSIKLTYSILCAGLRCLAAPGPDGEILFSRNDDGYFTSKGSVDSFPNVEAYHYSSIDDAPRTLFRLRFVDQNELYNGAASFEDSTLGMLGVNTFEWDYTGNQYRMGGY